MPVTRLFVRCTRCGARALLYTITPELLQHEPEAPLDADPARAWMHEHQLAAHGPYDALQQRLHREGERWLRGYRAGLPPRPYEILTEEA